MPIHLEIKQRKLVIKGWLGISRTGAWGLPHYCIPLVCIPNIHGGFVVWRLNQPKQEGICKRNTAVQCRLPTHCATKHVFKSKKCSQVSDFVWPSRTTQANLLLLRQHVSMEQHGSMTTDYSSSKTMSRVSVMFHHLFVAALDIDLWVEWVNTEGNVTNLPSGV